MHSADAQRSHSNEYRSRHKLFQQLSLFHSTLESSSGHYTKQDSNRISQKSLRSTAKAYSQSIPLTERNSKPIYRSSLSIFHFGFCANPIQFKTHPTKNYQLNDNNEQRTCGLGQLDQ